VKDLLTDGSDRCATVSLPQSLRSTKLVPRRIAWDEPSRIARRVRGVETNRYPVP